MNFYINAQNNNYKSILREIIYEYRFKYNLNMNNLKLSQHVNLAYQKKECLLTIRNLKKIFIN